MTKIKEKYSLSRSFSVNRLLRPIHIKQKQKRKLSLIFVIYYRLQMKLRKGNVFTPVSQSFCSQGGLPQYMLGCILPQTRCRHPPRPEADPPKPPRTRGRHSPPGAVHAGRYGQQEGGTHPTGMHSCSLNFFACRLIFFRFRSHFRMVGMDP